MNCKISFIQALLLLAATAVLTPALTGCDGTQGGTPDLSAPTGYDDMLGFAADPIPVVRSVSSAWVCADRGL